MQCALNKGTWAAGTAKAEGASAHKAAVASIREARKGDAKSRLDCAIGRTAARPTPPCAVAQVVWAGGGAMQGIPHAPGTLQWQLAQWQVWAGVGVMQGIPHAPGTLQWQLAQWHCVDSSTGCTCTKAAQKAAMRTQARRFMGLGVRMGVWARGANVILGMRPWPRDVRFPNGRR